MFPDGLLGLSNHRIRRRDTSRAPCHRPATVPTQLWRNSSQYREEQLRSPVARCDVRQARRVLAQPAPAALLLTKNRPESSDPDESMFPTPSSTSRVHTESGNTTEIAFVSKLLARQSQAQSASSFGIGRPER